MLRAEADMPIEDLLAQYEGNVPIPQEIKNLRKKKNILSPLIKAKRPRFPTESGDVGDMLDDDDENDEREISKPSNPNASSTVTSHSVSVGENLANHANGHAENENNLNREKEQNEILQKQSLQHQNSESKPSTRDSIECDSGVKATVAVEGETTLSVTSEKMDSEVCSSSSSAAATSSSSSSSGQCSSNVVQNSSVSSSDNFATDDKTCSKKAGVSRSSEADSTCGEIGLGVNTKVNQDSDVGPSGSSQSDTCVQSSSSNICEDMGPSSSGSGEVCNCYSDLNENHYLNCIFFHVLYRHSLAVFLSQ